jgi:hypothetical protein
MTHSLCAEVSKCSPRNPDAAACLIRQNELLGNVRETSGYQGGNIPLEGYLQFAAAGSKARERDGSDRFCEVLSDSVRFCRVLSSGM